MTETRLTPARRDLTGPFCACGCGSAITRTYRRTRGENHRGQPHKFLRHHAKARPSKSPYLHRAIGGKRKKAHVAIVEAVLGRSLPKGAQVHHVDGNGMNNAHSNLVVCQDQTYHHLLHARQRIVAAGGNPDTHRVCWGCKRAVLIADLAGGAVTRSNKCQPCWHAYQQKRGHKK